MKRELSLEFVRVTEWAAIAAARSVGRGDKNLTDGLAVDAMRKMFDTVNISGGHRGRGTGRGPHAVYRGKGWSRRR